MQVFKINFIFQDSQWLWWKIWNIYLRLINKICEIIFLKFAYIWFQDRVWRTSWLYVHHMCSQSHERCTFCWRRGWVNGWGVAAAGRMQKGAFWRRGRVSNGGGWRRVGVAACYKRSPRRSRPTLARWPPLRPPPSLSHALAQVRSL
jgi:hypothetical protein